MNSSPSRITSLKPGEVFVFGANEAGIHGAGAAKQALKFGAKYGHYGRRNQTYGIPTKDKDIKTLPLESIDGHVARFIVHATCNPDTTFLVTEIGCGLAGYQPEQIAPMFRNIPENIILPESFNSILNS